MNTAPPVATDLAAILTNAGAVTGLPSLIGWLDCQHQHHHDALAAEVHDQLGSNLTALAMRLAALERRSAAVPGLADAWSKTRQLLTATTQAARQVQHQLRPLALDTLGLEAALSAYLRDLDQRSGLACSLAQDGAPLELPVPQAQAVFRIVAGALENVLQHAGTCRAQIHLINQPDGRRVLIDDDGVGFDCDTVDWAHCHGLRLMQARADLLGAQLTLATAAGQGTRILLTLPAAL